MYRLVGVGYTSGTNYRLLDESGNIVCVSAKEIIKHSSGKFLYKGKQVTGFANPGDIARCRFLYKNMVVRENLILAEIPENKDGVYYIPDYVNYLLEPLCPSSDGKLVVTGGKGLLSYTVGMKSISEMCSIFDCGVCVDVSGLDTYGHAAANMFSGCFNLVVVTLGNMDLSLSPSLYKMFYSCKSLVSVDFSGVEFGSSDKSCSGMFALCGKLKNIIGMSFCCNNASSMFYRCAALKNVDLTNVSFKSINVNYDMADFSLSLVCMFDGCNKLVNVVFGNNNTDLLVGFVNLYNMFRSCFYLKCVSFGDLNLKGVTHINIVDMFRWGNGDFILKFGNFVFPDNVTIVIDKVKEVCYKGGVSVH